MAFKNIFRSGKEAHNLGLVALGTLLGLMPSGSTNKTSSLPTVYVISAASIAARGSIAGLAIRIVARVDGFKTKILSKFPNGSGFLSKS
jgi:hypothetical protein